LRGWIYNIEKWIDKFKHWKVDYGFERKNINIQIELRNCDDEYIALKSGLMNWEKEYQHWKVDFGIERKIWALKNGLMNWKEE
jgi:hypothetical protein